MIKFDHQNLMIKFWPSNFEDQMLTIQVWSSNFDHHNLLIKFWPSKFEHQTLTITIWLAWPSFSSSCQSERGGWHWLIKFWWSKCDWPLFWHLTSVFWRSECHNRMLMIKIGCRSWSMDAVRQQPIQPAGRSGRYALSAISRTCQSEFDCQQSAEKHERSNFASCKWMQARRHD